MPVCVSARCALALQDGHVATARAGRQAGCVMLVSTPVALRQSLVWSCAGASVCGVPHSARTCCWTYRHDLDVAAGGVVCPAKRTARTLLPPLVSALAAGQVIFRVLRTGGDQLPDVAADAALRRRPHDSVLLTRIQALQGCRKGAAAICQGVAH